MTKYIFIDESGDLGFAKGSSKHIIISAIVVEDVKILKHIIKKTRKSAKFRKELKNRIEIKATYASRDLKIHLLNKLNELEEIEFFSIIVNKNKISNYKLKNNSDNFYNIITSQLAKKLCYHNENLEIIIDNSKIGSYKRSEFNKLFTYNIHINSTLNAFKIEHKDSFGEYGLQLADLVAWSKFQELEFSNSEFITLLEKHKLFIFEEY